MMQHTLTEKQNGVAVVSHAHPQLATTEAAEAAEFKLLDSGGTGGKMLVVPRPQHQ